MALDKAWIEVDEVRFGPEGSENNISRCKAVGPKGQLNSLSGNAIHMGFGLSADAAVADFIRRNDSKVLEAIADA